MIIIVSFLQGIHTHIPETNHIPRGYIVASILCLLFMVPLSLVPALALLFFYVSTSRSMCAVLSMAVFCSSLTSWFPGMSLTYYFHNHYHHVSSFILFKMLLGCSLLSNVWRYLYLHAYISTTTITSVNYEKNLLDSLL
jgi:hypothetical protein